MHSSPASTVRRQGDHERRRGRVVPDAYGTALAAATAEELFREVQRLGRRKVGGGATTSSPRHVVGSAGGVEDAPVKGEAERLLNEIVSRSRGGVMPARLFRDAVYLANALGLHHHSVELYTVRATKAAGGSLGASWDGGSGTVPTAVTGAGGLTELTLHDAVVDSAAQLSRPAQQLANVVALIEPKLRDMGDMQSELAVLRAFWLSVVVIKRSRRRNPASIGPSGAHSSRVATTTAEDATVEATDTTTCSRAIFGTWSIATKGKVVAQHGNVDAAFRHWRRVAQQLTLYSDDDDGESAFFARAVATGVIAPRPDGVVSFCTAAMRSARRVQPPELSAEKVTAFYRDYVAQVSASHGGAGSSTTSALKVEEMVTHAYVSHLLDVGDVHAVVRDLWSMLAQLRDSKHAPPSPSLLALYMRAIGELSRVVGSSSSTAIGDGAKRRGPFTTTAAPSSELLSSRADLEWLADECLRLSLTHPTLTPSLYEIFQTLWTMAKLGASRFLEALRTCFELKLIEGKDEELVFLKVQWALNRPRDEALAVVRGVMHAAFTHEAISASFLQTPPAADPVLVVDALDDAPPWTLLMRPAKAAASCDLLSERVMTVVLQVLLRHEHPAFFDVYRVFGDMLTRSADASPLSLHAADRPSKLRSISPAVVAGRASTPPRKKHWVEMLLVWYDRQRRGSLSNGVLAYVAEELRLVGMENIDGPSAEHRAQVALLRSDLREDGSPIAFRRTLLPGSAPAVRDPRSLFVARRAPGFGNLPRFVAIMPQLDADGPRRGGLASTTKGWKDAVHEVTPHPVVPPTRAKAATDLLTCSLLLHCAPVRATTNTDLEQPISGSSSLVRAVADSLTLATASAWMGRVPVNL